jgi:type IV secretion system protein VirB2
MKSSASILTILRRAAADFALSAICFGVPRLVFAQAAGGSPFQTGAESVVTNFVAIATPFAVIGVMVLGVLALGKQISWGWVIGAVVGIGVVFGAPQIVAWVRGLFGV